MDAEKTVHSVWNRDWMCEVSMGDFSMVIDEPTSVPNGTNLGPNPTAVLLGSVASCFTLAISWAARRHKVDLTELLVDATGTYDGPSFKTIRIEAAVGCPPDKLDDVLADAERLCYVTNTLRGGCEIVIEGSSI